ncbi:hypothetical protein Btru_011159 [Bulinus truncatus]|nr:hypothetical protein Btru_011159 [Bulinus truncatus]
MAPIPCQLLQKCYGTHSLSTLTEVLWHTFPVNSYRSAMAPIPCQLLQKCYGTHSLSTLTEVLWHPFPVNSYRSAMAPIPCQLLQKCYGTHSLSTLTEVLWHPFPVNSYRSAMAPIPCQLLQKCNGTHSLATLTEVQCHSLGSDPLTQTVRGKLQNQRQKLNEKINKELRMRAGAENLHKAAESNKKLRDRVALELSYFNSNIQLLKEQLSDMNSSVEVYQHENPRDLLSTVNSCLATTANICPQEVVTYGTWPDLNKQILVLFIHILPGVDQY